MKHDVATQLCRKSKPGREDSPAIPLVDLMKVQVGTFKSLASDDLGPEPINATRSLLDLMSS